MDLKTVIAELKKTEFKIDAYKLLLATVDFLTLTIGKHLKGADISTTFLALGFEEYTGLTTVVFRSWGINHSKDIGKMAYHLIDLKILKADETDSIDDYDVEEDWNHLLNEMTEEYYTCIEKGVKYDTLSG